MRSLHDSWELGGVTIPNRVVLAPLAGIGNWFVRLQAKRYGAGLAVSEMVSSFAIHYGNRKTHDELLRVDPREREAGPVAIQLFGQDPEIMRSAAAHVAGIGADLIDLNMGCPVPKVMKTGAGAALLSDPDTAVAVALAAREGSGLPVTVKLRAEGVDVARRLVSEAGVAGITFHPRTIKVRHKGTPDYDLARELVESLPVPVIVTGGHGRPRPRALGLRVHGLRGGHAGAWLARQSVAVLAGPGAARLGADGGRDCGGMALGAGSRGGASRRRPGRALLEEISPVVRGAARCPARRAGRAPACSDAC